MADEMLGEVSRRLRLTRRGHDLVMRELQSHLDQSRRDLESSGRSQEDAVQESIRRFGDPVEVAEMLTRVHRRTPSRFMMVLLATLLLGAVSAWFGASGTFAFARHHGHHVHVATHHTPAVPARHGASVRPHS